MASSTQSPESTGDLDGLIDSCIGLKKGDTEFVLRCFGGGEWWAEIGNPSGCVSLGEAEAEFTASGPTRREAVTNLLRDLVATGGVAPDRRSAEQQHISSMSDEELEDFNALVASHARPDQIVGQIIRASRITASRISEEAVRASKLSVELGSAGGGQLGGGRIAEPTLLANYERARFYIFAALAGMEVLPPRPEESIQIPGLFQLVRDSDGSPLSERIPGVLDAQFGGLEMKLRSLDREGGALMLVSSETDRANLLFFDEKHEGDAVAYWHAGLLSAGWSVGLT